MDKTKERFYILDILRGLAVLLMILSHSVYFFHARDNSFLLSLETIGNTLAFTGFLLLSGTVSFVAYLKDPHEKSLFRRVGRRVLTLLVAYYILALVITLPDISTAVGFDKIRIVADIIFFRNLPSFTEFLPPFIVYSLLIVIWPHFFQKLGASLKRVLFFSTLAYLIGFFLFKLPVPEFFLPWKAFLAGAEGFYRFPLLQYLPVYIFGLFWGQQLLRLPDLAQKKKFANKSALAFVGLFLFVIALFAASGSSFDKLLLRWPPSPGFLLLGLGIWLVLGSLVYFYRQLRSWPLLRDFFLVLGQNTLALTWAHIFILSLYQMAGGARVSSPLIVLLLFILVLLLSLALATFLPFNFKFVLDFHRSSIEEREEMVERQAIYALGQEAVQDSKKEVHWLKRFFFPRPDGTRKTKRLIRKRHILAGIIIAAVVVAAIFPVALDEATTLFFPKKAAPWANDEFAYRAPVTVINSDPFTNISVGQTLKFTFNHADLVQQNESNADGSDLFFVYDNGQKVDFYLENADQKDTSIIFRSASDISGGKKDSNYYLYFGNSTSQSLATKIEANNPPAHYSTSLGNVEIFPNLAVIDRRWNLIEKGKKPANPTISLEIDPSFSQDSAQVSVQGTAVTNGLKYLDGSFTGEIPLAGLKPGSYLAQVSVIKDGVTVITSQKAGFNISYPLYVAWTIDWEGYDTKNAYLEAMNNIANTYDLPMTHFVNARTFMTTDISPERQQYLTDWLQSRINKGDDMGLHLHMFYDLVTAAGVTARHDPNWGDRGDGYGVPVTAYTPEELTKIITYSRDVFASRGLPDPDIFRGGAWFADTQTLQTIASLGFLADSSGRTAYSFGSQNMKGPWNLKATTAPYRPSSSDQNVSSLADYIDILEIPNNGADSYWFFAVDMINRFKENFTGKPLVEQNQITFLSHPHWFDSKEQDKVRTLLGNVSKYDNAKDHGPIVFTTTDNIASIWLSK